MRSLSGSLWRAYALLNGSVISFIGNERNLAAWLALLVMDLDRTPIKGSDRCQEQIIIQSHAADPCLYHSTRNMKKENDMNWLSEK